MLEKNTIIYDFECATKKNMGHVPYFNHVTRLWKDEKIEETHLCIMIILKMLI